MNSFEKYRQRLAFYDVYGKIVQYFLIAQVVLAVMGKKPVYGTAFGNTIFVLYMVFLPTYPLFMWLSRGRNCKNCGKKIISSQFLKMYTYACPHCGNTDFPEK